MHRQKKNTDKQCTVTLSVPTVTAGGKVPRFTTKTDSRESITDKNANDVTQCVNHTELRRRRAPCVGWKLDPVVVTRRAIPTQLKHTGAICVKSVNMEDHVPIKSSTGISTLNIRPLLSCNITK